MDPIRLRSGRDVWIRPITPDDAHALKLAYARLSPRSKYQRFLAPKPYLSASDTRYLTEVDGTDHYALVATPADEPNLIIGVGRYVRLPDDPLAAEFAIVVGDDFQGEGLATELLERLATVARSAGVERFTATMLAENRPAHRLMHRLAAGGLVPHGDVASRAQESHHGPIDELVVDVAA
jgi:RimJ/RimL family protein N-acetyltransferase